MKDIHFLDKELLPEFEKDRGLIYDIYCTDETGEQFIVEMQNKEHVNFRERTLFYLSQAIARQGEKGASWRFSLKAVYGVFFLNFSLTDLPRKLRTDQRLPFKARNAVFQRLEQIVDIASMSKEDRVKYDESIKVYRDRLAIMEFERQKGMAEGMQKGMAEGMQKGKAEGIIESKQEIARNLKQMGLAVEDITKATGLAPDDIARL